MTITGSMALVTGANRGIGRHFAEHLLERGASKVYATARRPETVDLPGAETLRLDITDPASVAAAARAAPDVTLLVNNPGVSTYGAAKAAQWSLTNGIRLELAGQRTLVTGLVLSSTDTDMVDAWDIEKNDPADVVRQALDGVEAGALEVVADEESARAKADLSADPATIWPELVP